MEGILKGDLLVIEERGKCIGAAEFDDRLPNTKMVRQLEHFSRFAGCQLLSVERCTMVLVAFQLISGNVDK